MKKIPTVRELKAKRRLQDALKKSKIDVARGNFSIKSPKEHIKDLLSFLRQK